MYVYIRTAILLDGAEIINKRFFRRFFLAIFSRRGAGGGGGGSGIVVEVGGMRKLGDLNNFHFPR